MFIKTLLQLKKEYLMIEKVIKEDRKNNCIIKVVGFDKLLVDHARKSEAKVIIRGLESCGRL